MKKDPLFKSIIYSIFSFIFVFSSLAACGSPNDLIPDLKPKYLLEGYRVDTSTKGNFDYYLITKGCYVGTYAVALKEDKQTTNLVSITIPEKTPADIAKGLGEVTGIWRGAFLKNPTESVTIGSNIKTIDCEAFLGSGIKTISIPYSVDNIGEAAFYACSKLTSAAFSNSSRTSSGSAVECDEYCEALSSSPDDESSEESPEESSEELSSVESSEESSVESSEESSEESSSEEVEEGECLPDDGWCHLKKIPSHCFFNCRSLTTLTLPGSIEEIEPEAFKGCASLSSSLFFQNIKTIRARAFEGCENLSSIYISKSMFPNGTIEPHAFNYCAAKAIMDIHFCANQSSDISTWLTNNPDWGWFKDLTKNDDDDKYDYTPEYGNSFFTNDWIYTVNEKNEVTIGSYIGPIPTHGFLAVPDEMEAPAGNKVTRISASAFNKAGLKDALYRLYLPTTLVAIENNMFNDTFKNLYVIDSNGALCTDWGVAETKGKTAKKLYEDKDITGRVDLSGLTDLAFIGFRAFANMSKRNDILLLHLPARLIAIGDEAFGVFSKNGLRKVNELRWDYDDEKSRLEVVGTDAFYKVGFQNTGADSNLHNNQTFNTAIVPTTIIFPRTFRYFGLLDKDKERFRNEFGFIYESSEKATKSDRPAHAFAACSLIHKVIFKGSDDSTKTSDLIIPLQTFVYNEMLQTIVFEERAGHKIFFHTQEGEGVGGDYAVCQQAIGCNAGGGNDEDGPDKDARNDFRGTPFLQTFVLPNKNTDLYIQAAAFQGNSRCAIYLSDTLSNGKVHGENKYCRWTKMTSWSGTKFGGVTNFNAIDIGDIPQWRTIGDESRYSAYLYKDSTHDPNVIHKSAHCYMGYCFAEDKNDLYTNGDKISYGFEQLIPIYEQVHFKQTILKSDTSANVSGNVNVEVGQGNPNEYAEAGDTNEKCSFICYDDSGSKVATMTNFLYRLYYGATTVDISTVRVPATVTVGSTSYAVTKIGKSAFSACYTCDNGKTRIREDNTIKIWEKDLTNVEIPDTITEIDDYAFMRAYGVKKLSTYPSANPTAAATEGVPSSLTYIGRHAFTFCNIVNFLNIPSTCEFYDTKENTHGITSVFSDDFSLRKITFTGNNPKYYVTTYTSTTGSETRTCALYSTDQATYNKNRLLLVLNRDADDRSQANTTDTEAVTGGGVKFKFAGAAYKDNPFLYGAFKMGYWIKSLDCGTASMDKEGDGATVLAQPLFSGLCNRTDGNAVSKEVYLGSPVKVETYTGVTCDLTGISGNLFAGYAPSFAFNGCENLKTVKLPAATGADAGKLLASGIFANVTSTTTEYKTENGDGTNGVLDLTDMGYTEIPSEVFKNNLSIKKIIAPADSFIFQNNSFEGCSNLTEVDFSNVTGTLTLNSACFKDTGISTITWPANTDTIVNINASAFENCSSLTSLTLPAKTNALGDNAFKGTGLTSVTAAGDLTSLTTIGKACFYGLTSLSSFDFSKFTALTRISENAFSGSGTLGETVKLPSTLSNVDNSAFSGSRITDVEFNSSSIDLKSKSFYGCMSLETVIFKINNCEWRDYNNDSGCFGKCPTLTELQLPTGYNIANNNKKNILATDSNDVANKTENVNIYTFTEFASGIKATKEWREHTESIGAPLSFYLDTTDLSKLVSANVITAGGGINSTNAGSTTFWMLDGDGHAIDLGHITAYDGATITFENGDTLPYAS